MRAGGGRWAGIWRPAPTPRSCAVTVAFDGCNSIKTPDAERNRGWLGKPCNRHGFTSYPVLRLMTLVETGTRGLLGASFGPSHRGENHYARRLLGPDQLVLADRYFDDAKLLARIADTGAQFLVRLASHRRLPTHDRLPDGFYLVHLRASRSASSRPTSPSPWPTTAHSTRATGS
ncbi:transposase [Streptomyces sp. NPDC053750]|uniref:transposase n=1 Tax=Streptomyces sp. NPDC053750 TaxID=3365714 RepID=UPI0037D1B8A5